MLLDVEYPCKGALPDLVVAQPVLNLNLPMNNCDMTLDILIRMMEGKTNDFLFS